MKHTNEAHRSARAERRARVEILNSAATGDERFFANSKAHFRVREPRLNELPDSIRDWLMPGLEVVVIASRHQRWAALLPAHDAQRTLEAAVVSGLRRDDDALRAMLLSGAVLRWFDLPGQDPAGGGAAAENVE